MVVLSLNYRCNSNCISCINNFEVYNKCKDPSFIDIKKTIDNLKNVEHIDLSGGEPTINKDFFKFLDYIRKKLPKTELLLISNGRMFFYNNFVRKLANLKLKNFKVALTIYGHNAVLHDKITRIKGSFKQTVEGIKNLLKYGIKTEVRVIINKINYKYLEEIAKFVDSNFKDKKNLERIVFINIEISGEAYKNRDKVVVKYSKIIPFLVKALDYLDRKISTRLYHFPLCTLPRKYWDIARGLSVEENELIFAPQCKDCKEKESCTRIWKSYAGVIGVNEFKAIKRI